MTILVERIDAPVAAPKARWRRDRQDETVQFAEAALARAKQSGLRLAVRTRWFALAVIAFTTSLRATYSGTGVSASVICPGFVEAGIYARLKAQTGRSAPALLGVSRPELALMFCDLALLMFTNIVPNPWSASHWPVAMQYHFGNFIYFFVLLSSATLAYSWRTVIAMGTWTAGLWVLGVIWVWWQPDRNPALTERIAAAIGDDTRLQPFLNPNVIGYGGRIQEIVVFLIVAVTLAVAVRRGNALLISHAAVERERTNLSRYFSPNVVEELSKHDEPLKQVRMQNVAVLFVDLLRPAPKSQAVF